MYDYGYGYSTTDYDTAASILGGFAIFGTIITIISLVLGILMLVSQWKIYKKAGKGGWESIVPIYNIIVLLQIVELPMWYIALFFVPFANIYAMFKIYIELAHKFGKSTGFGVATVFFNVICLPILAFGKNNVYNGATGNNNMQNQIPQYDFNNAVFQNESNSMQNNNVNNETEAPPFMFNQNINTEINQIQPVQNTDLNNQLQQPNTVVSNSLEPQTNINPTQESVSVESPVVNQQSETNIMPTMEVQPQPVETANTNDLNNQVNNSQPEVGQQENAFKYEIPTPVVNPQPEQTPPTTSINENQNTQPVSPQPQINVIPGMGTIQQPEMPNSNVGNNQNNPNM